MRPLFLAIALSSILVSSQSHAAEPGQQQPGALETQASVKMDYLLYLPEDYDEKKSWPLMLFLHGAGERGDNLERVKVHGPPKLIAAGKQFPFIVVSPQCPAGQWWEVVEVNALLDSIMEKYKVDEDRVYLTGLSMGGFGTWRLAMYRPERFAAIAPICGGGHRLWCREIKPIPVWAFHGAKDGVVPLEESQTMVTTLQKIGGNAKLTVYPDVSHDSWTETYDNPELYDWFLKHKRGK